MIYGIIFVVVAAFIGLAVTWAAGKDERARRRAIERGDEPPYDWENFN